MIGGGGGDDRPPGPLRWLLRLVLPRQDRELLTVEMEELYSRRRARGGALHAGLWSLWTIGGFALRLGPLRVDAWVRDAAADLRYGCRLLGRRPGYAATAILILGLGVGGVTSVYAVADWVLLRAVPGVRDQTGLVTLRKGSTESPRPSWPVSHAELAALRRGIGALTSLAARTPMDVNLAFEEELPPRRVRAAVVSSGWFETLGVRMAAGRPPTADPDPAQAGRGEIVLSWDVASSLAVRPVDALGRTVLVDGRPHRVVGVTERGFRGAELPGGTLAWLGSAALVDLVAGAPPDLFRQGYREVWDVMVGRRVPGAAVAAVQAQAHRTLEEIRRSGRPNTFSAVHFEFQALPGVGLDPGLRRPVRRTAALLAGAAAFLLLLAGLNVANLALTHAASRRTATAVRRALGAGRARLLRQALAEHAVLGAGGALVGVAVATAGVRLFRGVRLEEFGAALAGLTLQPEVVVVGVGLALATALAAGLGATLTLAVGPAHGIGGLRVGWSASPRSRHIRSALAATQVALSTVLVVGAGLMARTVVNLRALDLGFEPDGLLAFTVDPAGEGRGENRGLALLDAITSELEAEPGVEAAGFAYPEPLRTSYLTSWLERPDAPDGEGVVGAYLQVAGHFLEAMGVRLMAGRGLGGALSRSAGGGEPAVLVTRSGARALFPGSSPDRVVGALVSRSRPDEPPLHVVGVVAELRLTGPREEPPPVFVVPWAQGSDDVVAVGWVRARSGPASALAPAVRRAVRRVDPALPVYDVRTVRQQADRMASGERVLAGLVAAVSVLGVVLAAVGLHGMLAYAVTERRREIGIRTALGAARGHVLGSVLGSGVGIAAAGLVPGLLGALALTRVLESQLYGVEPLDPPTWVAGSLLVLAVAALASWIPALGATRVPVVEVLRAEG